MRGFLSTPIPPTWKESPFALHPSGSILVSKAGSILVSDNEQGQLNRVAEIVCPINFVWPQSFRRFLCGIPLNLPRGRLSSG